MTATRFTDLADSLEAAAPDELEALGWGAARVLLKPDAWDDEFLRPGHGLRASPALSLDVCERLHEASLPGWYWKLWRDDFGHKAVVRPGAFPSSAPVARAATPAAAWLAAMLRAKGAA
jgi:hypothetical protein